ncbi:MAG TPA: flotillin family protein [Lachnospiraceae bacterium]|nr:flotillin family protein [Lachnospiraceae bacterium]
MRPELILIASIVLFVLVICVLSYVKAPPDMAYIISGLRKNPKVLIGRAGLKIPFLERKDELIMRQISVDIKTNGYVPTKDFIGVNIDAIAKIAVDYEKPLDGKSTRELSPGIALAMKNFLNMDEKQIIQALADSLQGNMREIIGTVELKELCTNRKKFGDEVQSKAQLDMSALGIKIVSCNIQRIEDERGLITALGQDNMSQIQKEASIAKALADRDVAIAEADAKREANDAQVKSNTEIAIKQNELAIKQAELKKESDTKKAESDAAYSIMQQEQRKTIEITTSNANIARQEREIELKEKEALVKEKELDATVKRQADAERYKVQQESDASLYKRQKQAEAKKYEETQEAEARKIQAEAAKYTKEQEAAGIAAVGKAEAEAIQAKGIAEAEALEKKAEAMKKYGQAAMMEMIVKALPEMAREIAEPLKAIDKVTIIDGGDGNSGVSQMGGYVPAILAKTMESVKEATGIDLGEIMRASTYDAKVNRNLNVTGIVPEDGEETTQKEAAAAKENS